MVYSADNFGKQYSLENVKMAEQEEKYNKTERSSEDKYQWAKNVLVKKDVSDPDFRAALRYMEKYYPNASIYLEARALWNEAHGKVVDDADIYDKNANSLSILKGQYDYKSFKQEHEKLFSRISIWEESEEGSTDLNDAKANEYLENNLFKVAQEKARMKLAADKAFNTATVKEKEEIFRNTVKDFAIEDLCRVIAASQLKAPTQEEMTLGSQASKEYAQRVQETAKDVHKELFKTKKTKKSMIINADQLSMNVADYALQAEEFVSKLKQKAKKLKGQSREYLKQVADRFEIRKYKIEQKADEISNGRYSKLVKIFKNVGKSVKENKEQMFCNTAATVLLGLTGYGTVAIAAYGAYMAVSPYFFGVGKKVQEMRAKKRKEEKGQEKTRRTLKERFNETVKLWGDAGKEKFKDKKWVRKSLITTGIAIVSFGALAKYAGNINLEVAENGVRKAFSWVRMGVSNLVQATETGITGTSALIHKGNEKDKKDFKRALTGLAIGLGASAVTLGVRNLFGSSPEDAVSESLADSKELDVPSQTPTDTSTVVSSDPVDLPQETEPAPMHQDANTDAADIAGPVEVERFPMKWEDIDPKDRGSITEKQFRNLMANINNGKIADIDPQALDRAWTNMDDEFMSHFEGKTKMEAFWEIVTRDRIGRRHQFVLQDQDGFYIRTPMGNHRITDTGVIAQAKAALADGDRLQIARLHGRGFLKDQFELLAAEKMSEQQMSQVVEIAMHTYDPNQVAGAVAKVHELCPDLTKAELNKIGDIIDYNRRFDKDGESLEQLLGVIGCKNTVGIDYTKAGVVMAQTREIAASCTGDAMPVSQEIDCNGTMLHRIPGEKPIVEETIPDRKPAEFTHVPTTRGQVEYTSNESLREPTYRKPEYGRTYGGEFPSDDYNNVVGERALTNSEAEAGISTHNRIKKSDPIQWIVDKVKGQTK